jgi:hypothetical protein
VLYGVVWCYVVLCGVVCTCVCTILACQYVQSITKHWASPDLPGEAHVQVLLCKAPRGVTRVLQECYMSVVRVSREWYKMVTRLSQEWYRRVTRVLQARYNSVTSVLQRCCERVIPTEVTLNIIIVVLQGCYMGVTIVLLCVVVC